MKFALALLFAGAVNAAAAPPAHPPAASADALLQRIAQLGGRRVLADLWKDDRAFDAAMDGIESGDPAWLEVAIRLRPFSDAGASEAIDDAVARLLPAQPRRILSLIGHDGFEIGHVCTTPFIEPAPGVAEAYENKTLAALASVRDPDLAYLARECAQRVGLPGRSLRISVSRDSSRGAPRP